MDHRKGDWIQTYTGIHYWPLDPRHTDISIEDIAHALSHLCRYAGHCSRFYSVAEHSVLVSRIVPPEHALSALLHDATEAYLVDVPRPIKRLLTNYQEIEELNWKAIADAFAVPPVMDESIHHADAEILIQEMQVLMRGAVPNLPTEMLGKIIIPDDVFVIGMSPEWAKEAFLTRFKDVS